MAIVAHHHPELLKVDVAVHVGVNDTEEVLDVIQAHLNQLGLGLGLGLGLDVIQAHLNQLGLGLGLGLGLDVIQAHLNLMAVVIREDLERFFELLDRDRA